METSRIEGAAPVHATVTAVFTMPRVPLTGDSVRLEAPAGTVAVTDDAGNHWAQEEPGTWAAHEVLGMRTVTFTIGPVTEYGTLMSGGSVQVPPSDPECERIYPARLQMENLQRRGGHALRRRVIVVEDWEEMTPEQVAAIPLPDGWAEKQRARVTGSLGGDPDKDPDAVLPEDRDDEA